MPISGTKLGPYEILSAIGAGGMGEVYRARDPRIGREVAIKVLPADLTQHEDRLRRFELEARSVGQLNHPNILAIFDVGRENETPYLVTELLNGETLRKRFMEGSFSVKKAVEYAMQIAHGMAAAHEKGIIHRDLKPENLFLTKDGRIKILDFGLAKVAPPEVSSSQLTNVETLSRQTESGVVMGTVVYMSPEQVSGMKVDHRSDIFAFGTILFEMLSGERPFQGKTQVEVMHAILKTDVPDLQLTNSDVPAALERIVHRCLEKNPDRRFQSTSDLAFALESLSISTGTSQATSLPEGKRGRLLTFFLAGVVVLAIASASSYFIGKRHLLSQSVRTVGHAPYTLQQLTFRRGNIQNAFFAPDGHTVIFVASWNGNDSELFFTRIGNPEARSFGIKDAKLLSVSLTGEMAIQLRSSSHDFALAQLGFGGGAPREISYGMEYADWAPDGKSLLGVKRFSKNLEYPLGTVLYESDVIIRRPRFSPDGKLIAFTELRSLGVGDISVVNLSGKKQVLWSGPMHHSGLAWSPDGKEIWFGAKSKTLSGPTLNAVTLSGKHRELFPTNGILVLFDIAKDGRLLFGHGKGWNGIIYQSEKESGERDLSWLDHSAISDISDDGKNILFTELGQLLSAGIGSPSQSVYFRRVDEPEAVRLGEGTAIELSPDGKWALSFLNHSLVLLPIGPGQSKKLNTAKMVSGEACWLPDGERILYTAGEGDSSRIYIQNIDGGDPQPISPEGFYLSDHHAISPDSKFAITNDPANAEIYGVYDLAQQKVRPIGFEAGDQPIRWAADGRSIYFCRPYEIPLKIMQIDVDTGKRKLWKQLQMSDPAGLELMWSELTPDGKAYAYSYAGVLNDLYIIDGLK